MNYKKLCLARLVAIVRPSSGDSMLEESGVI